MKYIIEDHKDFRKVTITGPHKHKQSSKNGDCKNWSRETFLAQGLKQYTYFESKKVLSPIGAIDFCKYKKKHNIKELYRGSFARKIYFNSLFLAHRYFLRYFGPWEAWQRHLSIAWVKPTPKKSKKGDMSLQNKIMEKK